MAGNRSFINYISDRFYNNFYSYLEKHIEENQDNLDLDIQNVHNVGEIVLTDMEIKMASINDLPGMEIEFDVVIEAEIEVSEVSEETVQPELEENEDNENVSTNEE